MKILYNYLKRYKWLVFLALVLAAVNQGFSMTDPIIFQHLIDRVITPFIKNSSVFPTVKDFYMAALWWIGLSMGVAMVSRIAKNFQDYFTNVITLKLGAQIYSDGLKHSLELPYSVFEDQRSGETLGILQKVRADVEKFMLAFVSILFTTLIGVIFVFVYAIKIYWLI